MSRKQSYVSADGFDVLFDGSKTFWKSRSNLDILIALHSMQMCVEVVAYEATVGKEAPRIYLSAALLITKIDKDDCERKVAMRKETVLRQRKTFNQPAVMKEVFNQAMVQFILSRLNVVIPEGGTLNDIQVALVPISTDTVDDETGEMDVVCHKPGNLTSVVVNYQKKASAMEMKKAMNSLHAETLALQRATKMAELVTSSVDGFKLMLAEKMRLDAELKSMYSEPRLRWINAINRVLIQNFIAKVHDRLMNSNVRDWYIEMQAKVEEYERQQELLRQHDENDDDEDGDNSTIADTIASTAINQSNGTVNRVSPARSKMLRRSLDNSQLVRRKSGGGYLVLPQLQNGATAGAGATGSPQTSPTSPSHHFNNGFAKPVLPSLQSTSLKIPGGGSSDSTIMERRRLARAGKGGAAAGGVSPTAANKAATKRAKSLRRSFTDGVGVSTPNSRLMKERSGSLDSTEELAPIGGQAEHPRTPPSLLKSYAENVPKLLEPVSMAAFGDVTRSSKAKRAAAAR